MRKRPPEHGKNHSSISHATHLGALYWHFFCMDTSTPHGEHQAGRSVVALPPNEGKEGNLSLEGWIQFSSYFQVRDSSVSSPYHPGVGLAVAVLAPKATSCLYSTFMQVPTLCIPPKRLQQGWEHYWPNHQHHTLACLLSSIAVSTLFTAHSQPRGFLELR